MTSHTTVTGVWKACLLLPFAIFIFSFSNVMAHWTSKGPFGGTVTCFTIADTNIYLGTASGGIYRSTDQHASSWRMANYTGLSSGRISALTSIGKMIIAGTADSGVFTSSDLGATWQPKNNGLLSRSVLALAASGPIVYVSTQNGVFMSTDSGATWLAINTGLSVQLVSSFAISGTTLYAGTVSGGVFKNVSGSWTAINTTLQNLHVSSLSLSGSKLFAGTEQGIYYTDTAAISWSAAALTQTSVHALFADQDTVYAATDAGVYATSSEVINWLIVGVGAGADTVYALIRNAGQTFAGTSIGLFRHAPDEMTWTAASNGLNALETYTVLAADSLVITATNRGVYVSLDAANSYRLSNTGLTDSLHVAAFTFFDNKLYAATHAGVFMSADTGRSWNAANTGIVHPAISFLTAGDHNLYATTTDGYVYSMIKGGTGWTDISSGLPPGVVISALAAEGDSLFAGTRGNGVYRLSGNNWQAFNAGLSSTAINTLVIARNKIYAGTPASGIFSSSLNTPSWSAMNNGLPDLRITSLAATGEYVIAGYKGGVYATYNEGASWLSPNVLLYIPAYADVTAISFTTARIFIATPDNSVYSNAKAELPDYTLHNGIDEVSALHDLHIVPNPSDGHFNLSGVDMDDVKQVAVYDLAGKLVEQLACFTSTVEVHCAPGVYILSIHTPNGMITRKLMVH